MDIYYYGMDFPTLSLFLRTTQQRLLGIVDLGRSLMRPFFNNPPLEVQTFRDIYSMCYKK